MNRRFALALSGLLFAVVPAAAQDWPTKTVRIIVPFGPGSTPDMVGRLIADHMQQKLGQPFVIENRPGASANTGTEMVAKADPDGYTIGVSLGGPLAINTLLFAKLPYDPAKDLTLITMLTTQPSALVVHTSLGVDSVAELVDLLRRNPGKYNYGSIGNGSLSHLAMEALALKDYMAARAKDIPLGRIGRAEEFANMACFLVSDLGSYITGTAINIDGGRSPVV